MSLITQNQTYKDVYLFYIINEEIKHIPLTYLNSHDKSKQKGMTWPWICHGHSRTDASCLSVIERVHTFPPIFSLNRWKFYCCGQPIEWSLWERMWIFSVKNYISVGELNWKRLKKLLWYHLLESKFLGVEEI